MRSARRLEGAEAVASRRDVGDTTSLVVLLLVAVVCVAFWWRRPPWRARVGGMFAVMVVFATAWTLIQVAVGGRWVEVAAGPGFVRASSLVTAAALAFDVVVEIAVAYVPFPVLPVVSGLVRDPAPLPVRSTVRTRSAPSTPGG